MRILLTNDDGVHAVGLRALRRELKKIGEVTVVAPASEQSGVGHAITYLTPLQARQVWEDGEPMGYAVDGKPADCVKLGLMHLLGEPCDLLISGINAGANAGINVLYSGTVAAAIEGAFHKVLSIAVSLELAEEKYFEQAAQWAVKVIQQILRQEPQPGELFNINIPDLAQGPPVGIQPARQSLHSAINDYEARIDPRGEPYYWLKLEENDCPVDGSDVTGLKNRLITVTPLRFDLTHEQRLQEVQNWNFEL